MATAPPYGSFQFMAVRVTQASATGAPVLGANKGYFTKAVVKAGIKLDKDSGSRDTLKRGDGLVCATSKEDDIILAALLSLDCCNLDAALIGLMTGGPVITNGSTPSGFQILDSGDASPAGVIFEGWSRAWDNSIQAAPGSPFSGAVAYWHWVLPYLRSTIDDLTLDAKHNPISLVGESTHNDHATANGPYDDWPTYVAQQNGITRPLGVFLDTALPSVEGYLTVSALAS